MISRIKSENPAKYLLLHLGTQNKDEAIKRRDELYPFIIQTDKDGNETKYQTLEDVLIANPTFKKKSIANCLNGKRYFNTYMGCKWEYQGV